MPDAEHDVLTLRQALRWLAAYAVINPITVCFLVLTKLLVLDRLMDFSKLKTGGSSSRWLLFGRMLLAVVVVGSALGFVSNIVGAVFAVRAADLFAELGSGNSSSLDTFEKRSRAHGHANTETSQAARAASVHLLFEFIMLSLVVVAFSCAGVASIRRVRSALRGPENIQTVSMSPMHAGRTASAAHLSAAVVDPAVVVRAQKLQRQILVTCGVVFVAFVIRAVYTAMFLLASGAQDVDRACDKFGDTKCRVCNNAFANMLVWLMYTPQLYFSLAFLSQPVALLVALWGMTSGQTLNVMKARDVDAPR
jgi:hypothetical protein